jgi:hypothetical protein
MFSFDELFSVVPAGTAGVLGARFALKQAGAFEDGKPGIWHAVALWVGAHLTGNIVGAVFSQHAGAVAKVGALSYAGDLFARTHLFAGSDWIKNNISLAGEDDEGGGEEFEMIEGFQDQSELGAGGGWALSGMGASGDLIRDNAGNLYQLSGGGFGLDSGPGAGSRLAGFQPASALGGPRANPNSSSSFGYSP